MAVQAVNISDFPTLDHVPDGAAFPLASSRRVSQVVDNVADQSDRKYGSSKFLVIAHRGRGMNMLQSSDQRMKFIKENSIPAFLSAAEFPVDFIEFDVQVTKDDYPVIFHDPFILSEEKDEIIERRVTDLTVEEFLSYGPQRDPGKTGKPMFRRTKDGRLFEWKVENDAPLCTLQEVFDKVGHSVGFNIELKFDDLMVYKEDELTHIIQQILQVVIKNAKHRPIIFSSFLPDAAQLVKKLQSMYPVFFITNGGSQIYADVRRNSLEEAIEVCRVGCLDGIVAEVTSILRNPAAIGRIRDSRLSLLTYGQLNNVPDVVHLQHLLGIEGVIVDFVQEITEAVSNFNTSLERERRESSPEREMPMAKRREPHFSEQEFSLLMKLIPQISSLDGHIEQAGMLLKDGTLSSHIHNLIQVNQCK